MTASEELELMAPVMGDAPEAMMARVALQSQNAAIHIAERLSSCRAALERIALLYENPEPPSMHEISIRAYDMRCIARSALIETE